MKTLTPQQIVALGPCKGYDLERITELFDNKESVTYLEILDTNKIPLRDIVWLFCQPDVLDDNVREQWLEIIVTRAVKNHALHCDIEKVEKWATNWLSGDDRTTEAAHVAAYAADATAYAAYAVHAASYADRAAHAAVYAAHAAADTAVRAGYDAAYAACKTERKQQIQDLKDILQGK
jgi:hypothetical protein